jgi:hypothetical protein
MIKIRLADGKVLEVDPELLKPGSYIVKEIVIRQPGDRYVPGHFCPTCGNGIEEGTGRPYRYFPPRPEQQGLCPECAGGAHPESTVNRTLSPSDGKAEGRG